jgi:hypothetical protein
MAVSSCDSPLLEMASTRSSDWIMPRSPWLASAGCTNIAGRAGGRQRGGHLAPDVAALAHAHDHHAARTCQHLAAPPPAKDAPRRWRQYTQQSAASMSKVSRPGAGPVRSASKGGGRRWVMARFYRGLPAPSLASMGMTALELTLVYLLAAVLGVVACRSLKLPPMLGYLAVGVVIGPTRWRWPELRGCAPPGRVRCGVPDVRDRAGVQPAQAARHAQPCVRAGLLQVG